MHKDNSDNQLSPAGIAHSKKDVSFANTKPCRTRRCGENYCRVQECLWKKSKKGYVRYVSGIVLSLTRWQTQNTSLNKKANTSLNKKVNNSMNLRPWTNQSEKTISSNKP